MWDYSANYDEATQTVETMHGVFRARVMRDEYPDEPYNDFGCPVFRLDVAAYPVRVEYTGYGRESWMNDGIPDAEFALSKFMAEHGRHEGFEVFDRWLRIFHGGSAVSWSGYGYSDYIYVAYDTRAMREFWGQTGERLETSAPELEEWRNYVEGEVYGFTIDHACSFDEDGDPDDWSELDSCWGFYGEEYARSEALMCLNHAIEAIAASMLPLTG